MKPTLSFMRAEQPRALITRTDALGDVILTTPVYRALKLAKPDCHVAVLCREYTEPILRANPYIDEIITIGKEDPDELANTIHRIESGNYDLAIALYPSRFVASALKDARIPIRIGSARRFHSWKFTHRINQSRKRNEKSEAQYNLDLLQAIDIMSLDTIPEVVVSEAECEDARNTVKQLGLFQGSALRVGQGGFVVLHPGSGGSAIDWPLEQFVRLTEVLHAQGIATVFTGNAAEGKMIDSVAKDCSAPIVSLAGKTTLRELAATLALADVVVANSTGPLHLAAAVGVNTVGLFPKSAAMSPVRWAPPVANSTILQPNSEGKTLELSVAVVAEAIVSARSSMKVV